MAFVLIVNLNEKTKNIGKVAKFLFKILKCFCLKAANVGSISGKLPQGLATLHIMQSLLFSGPTSKETKPGFNPGLAPHLLYKRGRGEPRVKPGVWRPEMWALNTPLYREQNKQFFTSQMPSYGFTHNPIQN
jgi:hypothetical protein